MSQQQPQALNYDVVIVGGGMVGAALAAKLAQAGMQIALVEQRPPEAYSAEQPLDQRVSAINRHSEQLLDALGAWQHIHDMRLCPFRRMAVWDHGVGFDSGLHFNASDIKASHLGHIIENRVVQLGLWQVLSELADDPAIPGRVELFCPADIKHLELGESLDSDHLAGVELSDGRKIVGQLLVGADGANSMVRQAASIGLTSWDYDQHVLSVNVETPFEQQDITWQEFHADGPRAFLPLVENHASLVWYDKPARIRALMQLPDNQLRSEILAAFPARLGEITLRDRASFALTRRHAQAYSMGRVVLLGDAAHTINPMAGQGVNLGFKDVQVLGEELCKAFAAGQPLTGEPLKRYEQRRRPDNLLMQSAMDACYLAFGNDLAPVKLLRNLGLGLAERAGPIKHQVMKYAMGL